MVCFGKVCFKQSVAILNWSVSDFEFDNHLYIFQKMHNDIYLSLCNVQKHTASKQYQPPVDNGRGKIVI